MQVSSLEEVGVIAFGVRGGLYLKEKVFPKCTERTTWMSQKSGFQV